MAGADADGVLHLRRIEPERLAGCDGRGNRHQRGVMPAALADARPGDVAQPLREVPAHDQRRQQLAAVQAPELGEDERAGRQVGRVRGVLLPIDVVVIQRPGHQRVEQAGGDGVHLFAAADDGARAGLVEGAVVRAEQLHVVNLRPAERTAEGVEQKPLGGVDGFRREVVVGDVAGPLADRCRDGGHWQLLE